MADDVVDTIAQYDLDDDFPDYANEQNKELNQIVRNPKCPIFVYLPFLRFSSLLQLIPARQFPKKSNCYASSVF
jgi:hypothetical protein